jgi:hypothetical protein
MPNFEIITITFIELMKMIEEGLINFNPDYQREGVWELIQKQKLIETIFNGNDINPIKLSKCADGTYNCIDGKQRLTTLYAFYKCCFGIINTVNIDDIFDDESDQDESIDSDCESTSTYHNCNDNSIIEYSDDEYEQLSDEDIADSIESDEEMINTYIVFYKKPKRSVYNDYDNNSNFDVFTTEQVEQFNKQIIQLTIYKYPEDTRYEREVEIFNNTNTLVELKSGEKISAYFSKQKYAKAYNDMCEEIKNILPNKQRNRKQYFYTISQYVYTVYTRT